MKRKQILAILLAGTICAGSLLTACGSAEQKRQEKAAPAAVETIGAEAAGKGSVQMPPNPESPAAGECDDQQQNLENTDLVSDPKTASYQGVNGFCLALTRELLKEQEPGQNFITSPYSVWLPLAALTNGTEESVKKQLFTVLGHAGISQTDFNAMVKELQSGLYQETYRQMLEENGGSFESPLQIANAMFVAEESVVQEGFEQQFTEEFDGKLFSVDFGSQEAVSEVNAWVKEHTEGKISELIDSFDPQTVAAIANAIYFSDSWAEAFLQEDTAEDVFHGAGGDETVPFMNHRFIQGTYYADDRMEATVLETGRFGQLLLLLPKEGITPEELLAGIDQRMLSDIVAAKGRTVQLGLPRFQIESDSFSVKEAMEALGVPLTDSAQPCLSQVVQGERLYISQALQKAVIEVDEAGLTAAAATVMGMMRTSMPVEIDPVELKLDRPFAFVLQAEIKQAEPQILFTGVVNQIGKK